MVKQKWREPQAHHHNQDLVTVTENYATDKTFTAAQSRPSMKASSSISRQMSSQGPTLILPACSEGDRARRGPFECRARNRTWEGIPEFCRPFRCYKRPGWQIL